MRQKPFQYELERSHGSEYFVVHIAMQRFLSCRLPHFSHTHLLHHRALPPICTLMLITRFHTSSVTFAAACILSPTPALLTKISTSLNTLIASSIIFSTSSFTATFTFTP